MLTFFWIPLPAPWTFTKEWNWDLCLSSGFLFITFHLKGSILWSSVLVVYSIPIQLLIIQCYFLRISYILWIRSWSLFGRFHILCLQRVKVLPSIYFLFNLKWTNQLGFLREEMKMNYLFDILNVRRRDKVVHLGFRCGILEERRGTWSMWNIFWG